jgi:ATP-dependent helicase/nuclease subunit B
MTGFDRVTPAQKALIAALEAQGVAVRAAAENTNETRLELVRASDAQDEIAACAWWARKQLERDEGMRIGVLAPDLREMRSEIERVFRRVLMPETDDVFASMESMPFELSLGRPLGDVPVVRAALLLLRWAVGPLREEEVSWLLLSGFVSASEMEYLKLAQFDGKMRDSGSLSLELSLSLLLRKLNHPEWAVLDGLRARLGGMQTAAVRNRVMEEMRGPSRWVELAQLLLKQAGWAKTDRPDSVAFQALAKWEQVLEDIALLDFDGQRMTYNDFLRIVDQRISEVIFAPESQGAPVQIMGAMEASGQQFDAVWFLSADDQSWPLRGRMHPLLPSDLQQRKGMPHASAEMDWELAQAVTRRIAMSAPTVVFSFAQRNKDGELRASPLLTEVAPDTMWRESRGLIAELASEGIAHSPNKLEEVEDDSGVIAWPREQNAGGADVLKQQSACPFRAFASKRLSAKELNRSEWGLSAGERGKLLHEVLETIWSPEGGSLHTSEDLLAAIEENRLRELLKSAIEGVFERFVRKHGLDLSDDPWMAAYLESEKRRLRVRIGEWLEYEAERVPFEVEAAEKTLDDVRVGELKLRLRVDRIDRVADNKHLLIDYKTGQVTPAKWKGMRPDDPQLPIYAVFGNVGEVCGALFAHISAGKTRFSGAINDARARLIPNLDSTSALVKYPYTDAMRDEWTTALLNLAEDFLRGEAAVDPRDGRKTCEFCPLPGLCRIAEVPGVLKESTEEAAENGDE